MKLDTASALLAVTVVALDSFVIFRAISRDHGVHRTLAWIFAIVALPWIGALAYLAIASPSITRTTRRKALTAAVVRRAVAKSLGTARGRFEGARSLFQLATRVTGLPPTKGNRVELMAENELAFQRLEEALRGARESIWAEYYIVQNDATGRWFLELLAEKAAAGIDVRFIYDAMGSFRIDTARLKALRAAGGRAVMFLPLNPMSRRWSVYLRNHRKLILVDGELAFTGGMNIGDEYAGRLRRRGMQNFHDSHVELAGPVVDSLAQVFAEDWAFATDEHLEVHRESRSTGEQGKAIVSALPSGPDQTYNASWVVFFSAIASATNRVFLSSPYFIPDVGLERALGTAALRGVDVRILLPGRCDVMFVDSAARSYCRALLRLGVRVFHYQPRMLHAKTLLVDEDMCVVGSANIDIRSLRLNFELGTLVEDRSFARELEQRFERDMEDSVEWTSEAAAACSPLSRLGDSIVRLFSPML